MKKRYKLIPNKNLQLGNTELEINKEEKLIKLLKRARVFFGGVMTYKACEGIEFIDSIIRKAIIYKEPITIHVKDGILFAWIGISCVYFTIINAEIKFQLSKYFDLSFEGAFNDMKEEMYQEYVPQKKLQ